MTDVQTGIMSGAETINTSEPRIYSAKISAGSVKAFETIKIFNLAQAPADLRDCEEFMPLRPALNENEAGLVFIRVGRYETFQETDSNPDLTHTVTFLEYKLNRWLESSGATEGERVLLTWNDQPPANEASLC